MDEKFHIVDKRGTGSRKPPTDEQLINMSAEDLALLERQAASDDSGEPAGRKALCAFVVICDYDGNVEATNDLHAVDGLVLARQATFADMFSAAAHLQKDIASQEASMRVMAAIQAQARMAMEARNSQQVRDQLANLKLRG